MDSSLSLSSLSVGKEREGGSPFFSSFVVFQRTAGLLVVKERTLSLRDGIYETEGKRFCCTEKSRFFFIPFLFVVLVVVVFAQISKLKKFRSLNANRSRHTTTTCVYFSVELPNGIKLHK